MSETPKPFKTDTEFAQETVKLVAAILALMQPASHAELEKVINIAARLVETSVKERIDQVLARSAEITKNGMEGK